jgi:hypothetical protein
MATERLRVVPVGKADPQKVTASPTTEESFPLSTSPPTSEPTNDAQQAMLSQTLGVIAAIAGLTAVRALLLLAVAGAFYLATIAASGPPSSLYVLIAYAVLIVLPLVWLDSTRRGGG